jgi:CRP-like cAMP-binding protein
VETVESSDVIEELGLAYFNELATFGALSDEVIEGLLRGGTITRYRVGEYLSRFGESATSFFVVLQGRFAYYKHCENHAVLTRYFHTGEQSGFDLMIGMIPHNGTDVAVEESLFLEISREQFYDLHVEHPGEFGLLMINLSRELSREIEMLEDVISTSLGWMSGS